MEQEVLDKPKLSAVAIYNPIEAGIALMLEKHGHVLTSPPVVKDDPKALALAKTGERELIKFRTSLEQARKTEKADSLAYGRLVDSEAARIQAVATPLELAYKKAITDEEDRLEAIRQAELEAERQRIAHHRARIQSIKEVRETASMCRTADRLKQLIDGMPAHLEKPFEEFQGEAETAFNEVCTVLQQMHGVKVEAEVQAAELKRQQEELARQREEQTALALAASQARMKEEAEAKVRRDAEEAELQAKRDAFEKDQAAARAAQQAQADQLAAQQREIDEQKARDAAVEFLTICRPAPLTAQDIAEGVVDAEVKPVAHANGAPIFSSTVFKENGDPIMLDGQGKRSIFCDVDEIPEVSLAVMTLGQINTRFGPGLTLTADFLRSLGFEPAERDKKRPAAVLYRESDFFHIGTALAAHATRVRDRHNV